MNPGLEHVRIDRWLCAARLFKSRTLAQRACTAGHVCVNGAPAKPSHVLSVGDEVSAALPRGQAIVKVLGLAEKRLSGSFARELYEDHSPPSPPREPHVARRARGAGRPTKAERRATDRLRAGT